VASQLIALACVLGAVLWWWESNRARERALIWARSACQRAGVQLLDQTVALRRTRFRREAGGRLAVWRYYGFEFTDTGERRCEGRAILLGARLLDLQLDLRDSDDPPTSH